MKNLISEAPRKILITVARNVQIKRWTPWRRHFLQILSLLSYLSGIKCLSYIKNELIFVSRDFFLPLLIEKKLSMFVRSRLGCFLKFLEKFENYTKKWSIGSQTSLDNLIVNKSWLSIRANSKVSVKKPFSITDRTILRSQHHKSDFPLRHYQNETSNRSLRSAGRMWCRWKSLIWFQTCFDAGNK